MGAPTVAFDVNDNLNSAIAPYYGNFFLTDDGILEWGTPTSDVLVDYHDLNCTSFKGALLDIDNLERWDIKVYTRSGQCYIKSYCSPNYSGGLHCDGTSMGNGSATIFDFFVNPQDPISFVIFSYNGDSPSVGFALDNFSYCDGTFPIHGGNENLAIPTRTCPPYSGLSCVSQHTQRKSNSQASNKCNYNLFPNPIVNGEKLTLSHLKTNASCTIESILNISIYDMSGKLIHSELPIEKHLKHVVCTIPQTLKNGFYLLKLITLDGQHFNKFMIMN